IADDGGRIRKVSNPSPSWGFSFVDRGAASIATAGGGANIDVGYAKIQANGGATPSGIAIFGYRVNGVLVTEAGVPSSPALLSGRIYAEISSDGSVNTGLAIANPNPGGTRVDFTFTNAIGIDTITGSALVPG